MLTKLHMIFKECKLAVFWLAKPIVSYDARCIRSDLRGVAGRVRTSGSALPVSSLRRSWIAC
jgi:hypothetical protein